MVIALPFAVLAGLLVGSFLNVCIDRLPANVSLLFPRSHCDTCKRLIPLYDLVPLLSYAILRGRCRYCRTRIPLRVVMVEALTGAVFGYVGARFGFSAEGVVLAVYSCILILVFFIDLEQTLVLNNVVFPATALALGLSPLLPDVGIVKSLYGVLLSFGGMLLLYVVARGGMGAGDVKLAAFIGAATGFPLVLVNLVLSVVVGGAVAAALLLAKIKKRKDPIPFGPFLAGGTVVTLFWGEQIVDLYNKLVEKGWITP